MKTQIKILTAIAGTLAIAAVAGAQNQQEIRRQRQSQIQDDAVCPACGAHRAPRHQAFQKNRNRPQQEGMRKAPRNARQLQSQRIRQQSIKRFDFDQDGQLSTAERAARRAYVEALQQEHGGGPKAKPQRQKPPVD